MVANGGQQTSVFRNAHQIYMAAWGNPADPTNGGDINVKKRTYPSAEVVCALLLTVTG